MGFVRRFEAGVGFRAGSGVEWEPMDGGPVPGEDGVEGLGFGVVGDLGCDGLAVLVVQHFWEEADGCAGGAGVGVADDEGLFVLEEGEDGVHVDPLRVSHELGEADGCVVFGVIGLGNWGVLRRPAGRTGDGAYADGEGGGAGECDGDDVGSARGAGVEAAQVPEFLDGLDAEVVDVLDVVHDLGEPEVPEVDGLGGRVFVVDTVHLPAQGLDVELPALKNWREAGTMMNEAVNDWTAPWREEGRAEGRAQGQTEVMRRIAARKFDAETAQRLAERLAEIADPEQVAEVGEWLIECEHGDELIQRVERLCGTSAAGDGPSRG